MFPPKTQLFSPSPSVYLAHHKHPPIKFLLSMAHIDWPFVMGVREEFDSLRRQLLHGDSDLTMAQALSALLAEETRLQSMSSSVSLPPSVLAASQ